MIWFDASLEYPAQDALLRHCVASLLGLDPQSVDVVHDISEVRDAPATCFVHGGLEDAYSQILTLYLREAVQPDAVESGARLAQLLGRCVLLANDATADPYSFILMSGSGARSIVSVDREALDENRRYVISAREEP